MGQTRRRFVTGAALLPIMARLGAGTADATGARQALPPVTLSGGWVETSLTALTVRLLDQHGIAFAGVAPATGLASADGRLGVRNAIGGGTVSPDLTGGTVTFTGGIEYSREATSLTFGEFTADLTKGTLSAVPAVGGTPGARADMFTFSVLDSQTAFATGNITMTGLKLRVTGVAAGVFETAFGTAVFTAGHPFADESGSASVTPGGPG